MQKVKEGDLSQASLLFQRYHRRIYLYLGKMAGDYHLAEDLTQNVFEKLILYRKSFELDQNFEGWVYRIAKNVFLDHTKLQNRMRKGSEEGKSLVPLSTPSQSNLPPLDWRKSFPMVLLLKPVPSCMLRNAAEGTSFV